MRATEATTATLPQIEMARVKPVDQMPPNVRLSDDLIDLMKGFSLSSAEGIAAKPTTDRADEADMVARIAIVLRQQLSPVRTQLNAFTPNHGRVEISLE